jgi:ubiquinone/menaquinone biosynthesis C-methylase UbiE
MFPVLATPRDLRRHYNAAAAKWHHRIAALGYADAYRAAIAELLPSDARPHRVMDVGCGAGSFAHAFVQEKGRVECLTLIDPAAAMLHEAATRLSGAADEMTLLDRGLDALPRFPSQDVILCAHVIDHCPDPAHAIRRLGRALAPNGVILLIVSKPHWCNWLIWLNWRHRSYRPADMRAAVAAAGLRCLRDTGFASGAPSRTSHAYLITST